MRDAASPTSGSIGSIRPEVARLPVGGPGFKHGRCGYIGAGRTDSGGPHMSSHGSLALALTLGLACVASIAAGETAHAQERVVMVTVAGSLQDELGCTADWDPACVATQLTAEGGG